MKLIIDISKEDYMNIKKYYDNLPDFVPCDTERVCIAKGKPLIEDTDAISRVEAIQALTHFGDSLKRLHELPSVNPTTDLSKIRAEIIDKYMTADGRMGSVSADILKIIDKYSKGE